MATIEELMKKFHAEIGPEKLKWLMGHFNGTKTVEEMFTFLWDFKDAHIHFNPVLLPPEKCKGKAKDLQARGDDLFETQCYTDALQQYTLSIMHAPHPEISLTSSEENSTMKTPRVPKGEEYDALASGYAKRSAVLLELGHIEECLNDIQRAFSHGFSSDVETLEKRKSTCINLRNNNISGATGSPDSLIYLPKEDNNGKELKKVPTVDEPHPIFPSLSKSVKVIYSPEKGNHVIAERDIYPGEILGAERSACCSLDVDNLSSHCSTCLVKCLAPLPCPECTMVVFCSHKCKVKGLSSDHWLECRVLSTFISLGLQPVFSLPLKVLQHYSCEELRDFMKTHKREEQDSRHGIRDLSQSTDTTFKTLQSIEHLVHNKDLRPSGDLYVKCLISFVMTKLLQQSGRLFASRSGGPVTPSREDLLCIGQIVFTNQMKVSCNGFKILEIRCSGPFNQMNKNVIGNGLYPILCLFNHSCHPNCEPYCYGLTQVLRASRPIPAGSEITEGYIRGFYLQPKEMRQRSLLNVYQFNCICPACEANWPTYEELPSTLQFKCLDCSKAISSDAPVCMSCSLDYKRKDYDPEKQVLVDEWVSAANQVQEAFLKSQQIASKMMWGKEATQEDLESIYKAIVLLEKHVPFPCHPLWDAHDAFDLYFHKEREKIDAYEVN